MKIAYVARHNGQGNDDEGAIGWALEQLGHYVVRFSEYDAYGLGGNLYAHDFVLFHKWAGAAVRVGCPKVFWHFDRVASDPDEQGTKLERWTADRRRWMARTMADPELLCGFCTDGDWVAHHEPKCNCLIPSLEGAGQHSPTCSIFKPNKLVWLTQGFDERQAGKGRFRPELARDVVFFGTANENGQKRRRCLEALRERYGDRLWTLNKETRQPIHGRELADLCVSAKVIVAPDGPSTDRYWSNRVYLVTGLGGCLVHPICKELRGQYPVDDLPMYGNLEALFWWIDLLLSDARGQATVKERGHRRTMTKHTYRHRCEALVEEVRGRL